MPHIIDMYHHSESELERNLMMQVSHLRDKLREDKETHNSFVSAVFRIVNDIPDEVKMELIIKHGLLFFI